MNSTIIEKEFIDVIYAINKFWHYITSYPTFVHTDHTAITYMMNKPITNARVTRWLLLLQEFDITIVDKPGKENVVADFLSRFVNNSDYSPVEDSFPDEHILQYLFTLLGMQILLTTWLQVNFHVILLLEKRGKSFRKVLDFVELKVLTGVKIPRNKRRHCLFRKSQLDS